MIDDDAIANGRHCRNCGYDRSGLELLARCPECGRIPAESHGPETKSPGVTRAYVALGLGTLAWIGLVGFGIIAILLGVGAIAASLVAMHTLKRESGTDWRPMATAAGGLVLGVSGTLAGALVAWVIVASL
ncbi:MAG: hypothetical protein AB8F26_11025 [Phycisphaerales bacterium]